MTTLVPDPPAEARTIAATCVHVELVLSDPRDDDLSVDDLGFLADGSGNCFLLIGPDSATPEGTLRAICHSGEPSLSVLHLAGRCGPRLPFEFWTPLVEQAVQRRPEWRDRAAGRALGDVIKIVPLLVSDVCLCGSDDEGQPQQNVPVSIEAYDRAVPDPWLSGGPGAARWLETHRQRELQMLAERAIGLNSSPTTDAAVAVVRLTRVALSLRLLNYEGVHLVRLELPPDLECPCGAVRWVDEAAAT